MNKVQESAYKLALWSGNIGLSTAFMMAALTEGRNGAALLYVILLGVGGAGVIGSLHSFKTALNDLGSDAEPEKEKT